MLMFVLKISLGGIGVVIVAIVAVLCITLQSVIQSNNHTFFQNFKIQVTDNHLTYFVILAALFCVDRLGYALRFSKCSMCSGTDSLAVGTILPFAGNNPPNGWLLCNGQVLDPVTNPNLGPLHRLLGGTFDPLQAGSVRVPDLCGRTLVGMGAGPNLTPRQLGQFGGFESHQLTINEMPSHNHAVNDPGHGHTAQASSGAPQQIHGTVGYDVNSNYNRDVTVNPRQTGISIQNNGGNVPHNNMQPYVVVNFIIKY